MKLFTSSPKTAKVLKLASCGMALSILAAVIIFSDPLQLMIDSQLTLRTGSYLYKLWINPPLEVYFSVYVFNVTNLEAYVRGIDAKLKVDEVGPYVYQEILTNNNVTFNGNDTVTFRPRRQVKFVREKSIGDPKVDKIIAPNIPYMGVTSVAGGMSVFAALGVSAITHQLNSKPMLMISVHEYFWGYEDNLVKLASKFVPSVINFQRFGILERMFDEGDNVVTMKLPSKRKGGQKMDTDLRDYALEQWNGEETIKFWTKAKANVTNCNSIRGTYDGTLFPRNITKGETFRIYRKNICRSLPIAYSHPGKFNGIEAYYFKLQENAFDTDFTDPDSSCFCSHKKCLKKGLGNITPCYYNIPLSMSFPHFFNADPSLLAGIDGLSPNESKHGSEFVIQPQLGLPMRVKSRFQINLMVDEIKFNRDMNKFRNTVIPIIWLEIGVDDLTPDLKLVIFLVFNIFPYVQCGTIIALILAGVTLVGSSLFQCFWMPTSTITSSTAVIVAAATIMPSSTHMGGVGGGGCKKKYMNEEAKKMKANKVHKANVGSVALLSQPQVEHSRGGIEEQQQLLLEHEDSTTLLLPEFMT